VRASHAQSNQTRLALYQQAGEGVLQSPLLGYGAPRPQQNSTVNSVGTQGQLWLVMFSHGFPGLLFYVGFLFWAFWRTRRGRSRVEFWANVTLVIALIQLPFYGQLPGQVYLLMIATALALRERMIGRSSRSGPAGNGSVAATT